MNQEPAAGEPGAAVPESAPAPEPTAAASSVATAAPSKRQIPKWLPLALLAIIPALAVGLVVYFASSGGGSSAGNTGAIEGFLRLSSEGAVDAFNDKTPPGYPTDVPVFKGSKLVASFLIEQESGVSYFLVYSTSASVRDVYGYFRKTLDEDPWQIEVGSDSLDVEGITFSSPEDADVSGDMTIFRSELEGRTIIYVSFQDLTPSKDARAATKPFRPQGSLDLPQGFPTDVPIYDDSASIVIDSYFQRGAGFTQYYVSFVTKKSQNQVLTYYDELFTKRGWTVTEATGSTSNFSLGIDFNDNPQTLQGSVITDTFEEDDDYTRVDILIQANTNRTPTKGN